MKTETLTGSSKEEVEKKVKAWQDAHPGVEMKNYSLQEVGTQERFASKAARKNDSVSVSFSFDDGGN